MYGFVYSLCLLVALYWHADTVNGAGVPGQAEKAPTSKLNNLEALQLHDRQTFRRIALVIALTEHLAQEGVENTRNLTSQQFEGGLQQELEPRVIHMEERMKRSTTYQPYTANPYDLGPLNQCSTPKVSQCGYSSDVTVPEFMARRLPYFFNSLDSIISAQLEQVPGIDSGCLHGVANSLLCSVVATPRCIGNNMVNYRSFSVTVSGAVPNMFYTVL